MLGQLLHSFNPSRRTAPRQTQLESHTEDQHTKSLLFPEAQALHSAENTAYPLSGDAAFNTTALGNSYDGTQGEVELDQYKDIRILIAQGDIGVYEKQIIFDSKPTPPRANSPPQQSNRRPSRLPAPDKQLISSGQHGGVHARRASLVADPTPRSPISSAFQRSRTRTSSLSSMPNTDDLNAGRAKDTEDIIGAALECMFGSVYMSYRGAGHKIHIFPLEPRGAEQVTPKDVVREGYSSLGRAEGRKRSNLATSYTPSSMPPEFQNKPGASQSSLKDTRKRTVLITRTFSVPIPDDAELKGGKGARTPTAPGATSESAAYPFPKTEKKNPLAPGRHLFARPRRTPMYAIGIIVQLPVSSLPSRPGAHYGQSGQRPAFFGPSSLHGPESLCSSLDSDKRAGWHMVDNEFGADSALSTSFSSDVDDRVDSIGQHWDVVLRTLTSLQFALQDRIIAHLKVALQRTQSQSAGVKPTNSPIYSRDHSQSRIFVGLDPLSMEQYALAFDPYMIKAAEVASERIVRGMKTPRVVTGQNRWGVWRDEGRWLGRWAGGKEENFFLYNLLTAFLGNHTEWLAALGPKSYRRKFREQQRANMGDDFTIISRTVIICPDKMAARRLIYLLAAFLPPSPHTGYDAFSPMRPGTSASFRAYSQSPPLSMPLSRQPSLRRTINRRGKGAQPSGRAAVPAKGPGSATGELQDDKSVITENIGSRHHSRNPSESKSFTAGLGISALSDPAAARKNSAATTSTVTPDSTVPVAHFTMQRTNSSSAPANARPGSSESLASTNLLHNLKRSRSGHTSRPSSDSQNASKWGSFMSFWSGSARRESSTDHSDIVQSTDDGIGPAGASRKPIDNSSPTELERMVRELHLSPRDGVAVKDSEVSPRKIPQEPSSDGGVDSEHAKPTAARDIPAAPRARDVQIRMSVNEDDGVIDVEVPNLAGSPLMSPFTPGFNSSPSMDGSSFGQSSFQPFLYGEVDQSVSVAGWLGKFHPDFALQGVNPYPDLDRDVRLAMKNEPTPTIFATTPGSETGPTERWVDVCSALIADTRTYSVKRLKLRRRVRLIPMSSQPVATPGPLQMRSQYGNPYSLATSAPALPMSELHLEESFTEETIMDIDDVLIEAVSGILNGSNAASRPRSTTSSSRSSSRRGRANLRDGPAGGSDGGGGGGVNRDGPAVSTPGLETPRNEYGLAVLNALEQLAKEVHQEMKLDLTVRAKKREGEGGATVTGSSGGGGGHGHGAASKATGKPNERDSTLREGIRAWLRGVDEA